MRLLCWLCYAVTLGVVLCHSFRECVIMLTWGLCLEEQGYVVPLTLRWCRAISLRTMMYNLQLTANNLGLRAYNF